uniref:N-acetyltransferase domain-containing protein n=1 Tax=Homalodisca liturata TaxID=320908 RepID=A0A1B6K3T3_9HEMI
MSHIIREGKKSDCKEIRRLIQELADFEKMPNGPKITAEILEKDCFGTDPPLCGCYVVEEASEDQTKPDAVLIGYAIYYYSYWTWTGKTLFLEDLYISEKFRGNGLGTKLFKQIAKHAIENKCVVMEFNVLSWNPAGSFYESLGAVNLSKTRGVNLFRLSGEALLTFDMNKAFTFEFDDE